MSFLLSYCSFFARWLTIFSFSFSFSISFVSFAICRWYFVCVFFTRSPRFRWNILKYIYYIYTHTHTHCETLISTFYSFLLSFRSQCAHFLFDLSNEFACKMKCTVFVTTKANDWEIDLCLYAIDYHHSLHFWRCVVKIQSKATTSNNSKHFISSIVDCRTFETAVANSKVLHFSLKWFCFENIVH